MGTFRLTCHPQTPSNFVSAICVEVERTGDMAWFRYVVDCRLEGLCLPDPATPERADNLWQTTCFEAFIGNGQYTEFNFSPSRRWAAYDFGGYRAGLMIRNLSHDPEIGLDFGEGYLALEASVDLGGLDGKLALSAVIEERGGAKSYWALAHPPGKPDFHHRACFAARLPAPNAP